jgi:hypothetical protein
MWGGRHGSSERPEKRLMDDDNRYALVKVHGEDRLFDFEHGRYYQPSNGFKTKKQKARFMRVRSGVDVAKAKKERLDFLTLSTQYDKKQPRQRLKRIKDLNYAFTKLKQKIEYYWQKKLYCQFCQKNHLEPFEIHKRKKSVKYPEYWAMLRCKLRYIKVKTSEGGGVLHIIFRKPAHYPPIPKNWLHNEWLKIWGSWNTSIDEVPIDDAFHISSYVVGKYFVDQPIIRLSYGQQWVYSGFVKGFHKVIDVYANMRQSPKKDKEKHTPFKRAIEVWNKNLKNGCLPKSSYQRRLRWRKLPEKTQGIFGNFRVKTLQCCIDSPKYNWEYRTIWTIFTRLPKKLFNYNKICSYNKTNC